MKKKCGFIALLGLANAGKSTLLNALVGQKIAGVSRKPQTTRNKIAGISTQGNCQAIFFDTPGLCLDWVEKGQIYKLMYMEAQQSLKDADMVCYLVDSVKGMSESDVKFVEWILTSELPLFLLFTKSDVLERAERVLRVQELETFVTSTKEKFPDQIFTGLFISAKTKADVLNLSSCLQNHLPLGEWHYPPDDITDRPTKFIVEELIREKAFRSLGQELPFKIAVVVEKWEEKETTMIHASIISERESHKPMIIGRGGSKLKEIGTQARLDIEKLLDRKVFLKLNVKIEPDWTLKPHLLSEYQGLN